MAVIAVAACTGDRGAAPDPSRSSGSVSVARPVVPISVGRESAAKQYALFRAIDPCGLHDLAAAAAVTGDQPDELMPGDSLAVCTLRLHRGGFVPSWRFVVHVGVSFPADRRDAAAREDIAGITFYRRDTGPGGVSGGNQYCGFTRPVGPDFGISLSVRAPADAQGATQACVIARNYLQASVAYWTDMALRGEKVTEPQLPLSGVDPCVAAAAVFTQLGLTGTADPQSPYDCHLREQPGGGGVTAGITISYRVAGDPAAVTGGTGGGVQPVSIAGRAGTVSSADRRLLCLVSVSYDDRVAIEMEPVRVVQVVQITAGDCSAATRAAEAVLTMIAPR